MPVAVTDATFEREVLDSKGVTIVDFWAPWCGPCRMLSPILEDLAKEYDGKVKIAKVNVDENPIIASKYGIQSIPTLYFMKDGRPVGNVVGVYPKQSLSRTIDKLLQS